MITGRRSRAWRNSPLSIAFVNNMPDSAFLDTHRQFEELLCKGATGVEVELRCYTLPSIARSPELLSGASGPYRQIDWLWDSPPDGLVVTGSEPLTADLSEEAYWPDLAELLRWGEAVVPSTLLSCLSSHAAVLAIDGISRIPLPCKRSGVYLQGVDRSHPLAQGMRSRAALPHSRWNEIPATALAGCGYRLVIADPATGWSVATRERQGRLMTLLQGHPEYEPTTLLREYRRDVRRYLDGAAKAAPSLPVGYLDEAGAAAVAGFLAECGHDSLVWSKGFPFEEASRHIQADWYATSRRLLDNWVADAADRRQLSQVAMAAR